MELAAAQVTLILGPRKVHGSRRVVVSQGLVVNSGSGHIIGRMPQIRDGC